MIAAIVPSFVSVARRLGPCPALALIPLLLLQAPPARAYEVDTHFTMTFIQCRIMGLTEAEALTVACYDQGMDDSEGVIANTETIAAGRALGKNIEIPTFLPVAFQPNEEVLWHSIPIDGSASAVLTRKKVLWEQAIQERSAACRLKRLGVFFHYQQDTWAHRCHPDAHPTNFQPYQVPAGHARFGSQPDRPPYDPIAALRCLEEGLAYVSAYMATHLPDRRPNPLFNGYTAAKGALTKIGDKRDGTYFHQLASDASTPARKLVTDLIRAQINCYQVSMSANPYLPGYYTSDVADTTGTSGVIGTRKNKVLDALIGACRVNGIAIAIPRYIPRVSTLTTPLLQGECETSNWPG